MEKYDSAIYNLVCEVMNMKVVSINKDICIGCGMCTAIADAVFALGDDGLAEVKIPNGDLNDSELEDLAEQAKDACPSAAIIIEDK